MASLASRLWVRLGKVSLILLILINTYCVGSMKKIRFVLIPRARVPIVWLNGNTLKEEQKVVEVLK